MAKSLDDLMPSSEAPSEKVDAAQDLIDAVKEGDAKAVSLAFERLCELCMSEESDEDDELAYGDEEG